MKLSDFDYNLPKELIAQKPIEPRDHSRLLVLSLNESVNEAKAKIEHRHFYDLPEYLKKGDLLVLNNSKVFPARLKGRRQGSGGKVEVFLLRNERRDEENSVEWQCLIGGKKPRIGLSIEFDSENKYLLSPLFGVLKTDNHDGTWQVTFNLAYAEMMAEVEKIGDVPLPPYIKRQEGDLEETHDKKNYQTVYAVDSQKGSVAAPTAGFHFTRELIEVLKSKGIEFAYITLHVGLGTFLPVKTEDISEHKMHAEYVEIKKEVLAQIVQAKKEGRRVITVGTTSTRALEAVFSNEEYLRLLPLENENDTAKAGQGVNQNLAITKGYSDWVNIFIYPGFQFKVIDGIITNFHLPKSTLLMLVSALAGKKNIEEAYSQAVRESYRFFSYGDAMLLL